MLARLNSQKHLAPKEFDTELGKVLKAMRVKRLAEFPAAKPKKSTPKAKKTAPAKAKPRPKGDK